MKSCWEGKKMKFLSRNTITHFLISSSLSTPDHLLENDTADFHPLPFFTRALCFVLLEIGEEEKKIKYSYGKVSSFFFEGKKHVQWNRVYLNDRHEKRYTDIVILWCVCWIFSIIIVVVVPCRRKRVESQSSLNVLQRIHNDDDKKRIIVPEYHHITIFLFAFLLMRWYSLKWYEIHAADDATSSTHTWRKRKTNVMSIIN